MKLRTKILTVLLMLSIHGIQRQSSGIQTEHQQSLAQFVFDMISIQGTSQGIDTLDKYATSDKFYLSRKEVVRSVHILYGQGKKKIADRYYKAACVHIPKLKRSLAHSLFLKLQAEEISSAEIWLKLNKNSSEFYISASEIRHCIRTLSDINNLKAAKMMAQLYIEIDDKQDDPYMEMAKLCLTEGNNKAALEYAQKAVDTYDYKSFMQLAIEPLLPYKPTIIPSDTFDLFRSHGDLKNDTAYVFIQGGPMPDISAYNPRPLDLISTKRGILKIDVLQAQMINPTVLASDQQLTNEQSLYEHHQSAEMMHRVIQYLKNMGKTVFVIGHSYGCHISMEYLRTKPNLADRLIIMGSDLDEDLRNYQKNEDGSRKFIRWRDGETPYEEDFWGGFSLASILRPKMERIFSNTESLVSSHSKRRFTKLLKGKDLNNVTFYHAKFDESNGRSSQAELDFFHAHGADTYESYGDHHSMLSQEYMANIYDHLNKDKPLKFSVASTLEKDIDKSGVLYAIENYEKYKDQDNYFPISEKEVNVLGYRLINQKKVKEALEVFKLNVAEFPDSWNAHDSLGETYLTMGSHMMSKVHYKKSLQIHPGNTYAIQALSNMSLSK